MSSRTLAMTDDLHAYVMERGIREAPILERLRDETDDIPMAAMQISAEQGAFMQLLVELLGVRRYLEVGVFTGYSSLAVALALPTDGEITALDISEEWTAIARRYWDEAGVIEKVELRLGDAVAELDQLIDDGRSNSYDLAFIDAEKSDYDSYYEQCLRLVRPGGLIAIDNAFQNGRVVEADRTTENARIVDRLNAKIHDDQRVTMALVPIGDGLMLCRRRI